MVRLYNKTHGVRIDPDDSAYIQAKADREGISFAEVIRQYVAWGIETDQAEIVGRKLKCQPPTHQSHS